MEMQILDADYIVVDNRPVVRFFGKNREGESVCCFYSGMLPYFYVSGKGCEEILKKEGLEYEKSNMKPATEPDCQKEIFKVWLKDPSKTPDVRDKLRGYGFEPYEADIPFKYRVMADMGLLGMGWIDAIGSTMRTESVLVAKPVNAKEIKRVEELGNAPFRMMALDIETLMGADMPDVKKDPVIMVSLLFSQPHNGKTEMVLSTRSGEGVNYYENEKAMLEGLISIITGFDPDFIAGYNINGFDLPALIARMAANRIRPVFGRCSQKAAFSKKISQREKAYIPGRVVIDAYEIVKKDFSLARYDLGMVAESLLKKKKAGVKHSEINTFFRGTKEQYKKLVEYSLTDAALVMELLQKLNLVDKYLALARVSGALIQDVLGGGETTRIENLLLREFNKSGYIMPCKASDSEIAKREREKEGKLVGGYVIEPEKGLHSNVLVFDFKCFIGSTPILTNRGVIPIQEIVDKKLKVKVYSYSAEKQGFVGADIVNYFKYKLHGGGELIKVNAANGSELIATPNHMFFVYDRNKNQISEKPANELTTTDLLLEPLSLEIKETHNISPNKAKFLGYLFSEGYSTRRYITHLNHITTASQSIMTFGSNETEIVSDCVGAIKNEYGYLPGVYNRESTLNVRVTNKEIYDDISHMLLKIRYKNRESSPSSIQRVPAEIFASSRDAKAMFLKAYFSGDGTVNHIRKEIVLTSRNKKIIEDIKLLLMHFGIHSHISKFKTWNKFKGEQIEAYYLQINGKNNMKLFAREIGFVGKKQAKLLKVIGEVKTQHKWMLKNNIKLIRISKIERIGAEKTDYVYDLQVNNESHSFLADFLLVHNSMYPSIIETYNICPTTLVKGEAEEAKVNKTPSGVAFHKKDIREGVVPRIVNRLMKERQVVKKRLKLEKDPAKVRALDAEQWAVKIMSNAFYGYLGYVRAKTYNLDLANAVTSCGRDLIKKTVSFVEKEYGYKVVYGDTDSLMVKVPEKPMDELLEIGEKIAKEVTKQLHGSLELNFEKILKRFLPLTKKRYAAWSFEKTEDGWKDRIETRGIETVRRDWCRLVSETVGDVLEILMKREGVKEAEDYFKNVVKQLVEGKIPIQKLEVTKSMTKHAKGYKGMQPHIELVKKMQKRSPADAPGIGDRVRYVIVKGTDLLSKRAEDPLFVMEKGLKIDSGYYIENQLLPPLERLFAGIGISKSELLGNGKQRGLLEIINSQKAVGEAKLKAGDVTGFMCVGCHKFFASMPLSGCCDCGAELAFSSQKGMGREIEVKRENGA